jgi:hypothetical protein
MMITYHSREEENSMKITDRILWLCILMLMTWKNRKLRREEK